ncbi:MAG: flagellar motor protein MotB [Oscillospiraceae bacterium]
MAKKPKPEGKKYSYMDTYGDLVTLLLCFFVLLFAMSTVEETKYNAFVEALSDRFGNFPTNLSSVNTSSPVSGSDFGEDPPAGNVIDPEPTLPADFTEIQKAITEFIEENNLQGDVSVEIGESGAIFIRLSDNLLFGGDSAALRPESYVFLDFLGECFMPLQDQIFQAQFLGHTASIPGSSTDDWLLSAERAGRVSSYFEKNIGFSQYKIKSSFMGRSYPIGDNEIPEGRARNRRVDIIVIAADERLAEALVEAAKIYFPSDSTQFFEGPPEELPENMLDNISPIGDNYLDLTGLETGDRSALRDALDELGIIENDTSG